MCSCNDTHSSHRTMSNHDIHEAESIRVLIRLRPEEKNEIQKYGAPCAEATGVDEKAIAISSNGDALDGSSTDGYYDENEFKHRLLQKPRVFTYDRVFARQATQEQVFSSVSDLVDSVVSGYNATIFAYGATGSGKTFSMSGSENQPGIVPRAIRKVFHDVQNMASEDSETLFMVSMGFVELYNNKFRDLLAGQMDDNNNSSSKKGRRGASDNNLRNSHEFNNGSLRNSRDRGLKGPRIELHESPTGGVHLTGSKTLRMPVRSAEQAMLLVDAGNRARATAATNLNEHSSRSHSILTIHVESQRKVKLTTTNTSNSKRPPRIVCLGKMHLVDLAGSERLHMSGAEGKRATEAVNINLSLSALGNVLSALSKWNIQSSKPTTPTKEHHKKSSSKWNIAKDKLITKNKRPRIPYRDSKLTYLLRDSLGGNSKTIMLTTIRAPTAFYQQTKMSLMYASRAKNIRNSTHVNLDSIGNSEMQQVVGQVEQLRMKLLERTAEFQRLKGMHSNSSQESKLLKAQLLKLTEENNIERNELENKINKFTNQNNNNNELKQQYEELQDSVDQHRKIVTEQKQEISRLNVEKESVTKEAELLRKALNSVKDDANRIRNQRDTAAKRLTDESRRIQNIVSTWDKQKSQMTSHILELENELQTVQQQQESGTSKNGKATSEADLLLIQELKAQNDTLKSKIDLHKEIIHAQKEELFQEKNEKVNTIDILQKAALDVKALKNALDTERLKVETQVKERNGKSFKKDERF